MDATFIGMLSSSYVHINRCGSISSQQGVLHIFALEGRVVLAAILREGASGSPSGVTFQDPCTVLVIHRAVGVLYCRLSMLGRFT